MNAIIIEEKDFNILLQKLETIEQCLKVVQKPQKTIFDNADLIKILKVSSRTLANWRYKGKISFSQASGKIWYTEEDLNHFLSKYKIKSFTKGGNNGY